MERQVTHMVRLIDDLLDVSRIARGKFELRKEWLQLAPVLARAVESQRPMLKERQHRLEVTVSAEPLTLEADAARLEQVFANLLNNAAKYMEPGGSIVVTAAREGDQIVVRVRDTGIGIRPEMLGSIFEIFHQGDRLPGHMPEGLGLGLTLVRRLVEMHGGNVEAHSAGLGQGSEFVVRLPWVAQLPLVLARHTWKPATGHLRRLRILIVDDNVDGAKSLALVLGLGGCHEIQVAFDGPAALETAAAFHPDLVLLDIGLPKGMDGYQVAQRLWRLPGLEKTLIIALTGFGQEEDRLRSSNSGFAAHLVKPVDLDILQELLAQL
jgi:CheY-like chemotaxis protein